MARVTIHDVARAAGVSTATVSNAINGTGRMSEERREKIRTIAGELNFRPNAMARALTQKRSFTVGLLTDDAYGRFSFPVMAGVSEALADEGVSVFLCPVEADPRRAKQHIDALMDRRVDGIIVSGRRADLSIPLDLDAIDVPVVYALTKAPPGSSHPHAHVMFDDRQGERLAADWLVQLGRKRIAHVTGPKAHLAARSRADGYREATASPYRVMHGEWSEHWGHEAVAALWAGRSARPDAITCGSDQIARGVVDALRERGVDVPGTVSVVGFDNWQIVAEATRPPLTTVDLNLKEVGRRAGSIVLALSKGAPVPAEAQLVDCSLVVRESCGGADKQFAAEAKERAAAGKRAVSRRRVTPKGSERPSG